MGATGSADRLLADVGRLAAFMRSASLTDSIRSIELDLQDAAAPVAAAVAERYSVDRDLLTAAVRVRQQLGRINDVIHAVSIMLLLPVILEEGERVTNRPSLAAGNDPKRPYDLETDRRIAEFKLSNWLGADAARKRQTFKDLVHLAADQSGRRAELYVLGDAPERFLRTTSAAAAWGLDRSPSTRALFLERFGPLDMSISDFTRGPGAHVEIKDISILLPEAARVADVALEGDVDG